MNELQTKMLDDAKKGENFEFSAKVVKIVESDYYVGGIKFILNTEIAGHDRETGEVVLKDSFTKNVFEAVKQLRQFDKYIKLADTLAKGRQVNTDVISLVMTDAEIKCRKVFHKKDTPRVDVPNATYPRDTYVTEFISVTTHIDPAFVGFIVDACKNPTKRNNAIIDPTNI